MTQPMGTSRSSSSVLDYRAFSRYTRMSSAYSELVCALH